MDSLYILIPIALVFCVIAVAVFFWAVNGRQYDDLDTAARRILFDEEEPRRRPPDAEGADTSTEPKPDDEH